MKEQGLGSYDLQTKLSITKRKYIKN